MSPAHLPSTSGPHRDPAGRDPARRASARSAVEPFRPTAPDVRRAASLTPPTPPVFAAGGFEFEPGLLRDDCWRMLDSAVRSRLEQRAGHIQAWGARTRSDGRIKAFAFGDQGLCIAEPTTRPNGAPTYSISTYVLDPSTIRAKTVDHRPASRATGTRPAATAAPTGGSLPYSAPPGTGLSDGDRKVLGNLPPLAQQLLQEPFVRGESILRTHWDYEGTATSMDAVTIILAGPRTVTVAAGRMSVPPGHNLLTAHWALTCYRAGVIRRMGR